jgi:hypothetical protein
MAQAATALVLREEVAVTAQVVASRRVVVMGQAATGLVAREEVAESGRVAATAQAVTVVWRFVRKYSKRRSCS